MRVAAIQHDIVWADREANFAHLAPLIAGAAGVGRPAGRCSPRRSPPASRRPRRPRRARGRAVVAVPRRAGAASTGCGSAGRARRSPPTRGDDSGRTTRSCSPRPTATSIATARSTRSRTAARPSTSPPATSSSPSTIEGLRVSLFVCYDLRFADEFWQLADDTDVYLVPANWPEAEAAALAGAAAGAGDREPGVRRRLQPRRQRQRTAVQRRQPDHRSAGRAAGHAPRRRREHPARRHRCGRPCAEVRDTLPLPARPPIARVVAATVPELMFGCWRRAWIEFADGSRDDTTNVVWLQTESSMADVRIAADRAPDLRIAPACTSAPSTNYGRSRPADAQQWLHRLWAGRDRRRRTRRPLRNGTPADTGSTSNRCRRFPSRG